VSGPEDSEGIRRYASCRFAGASWLALLWGIGVVALATITTPASARGEPATDAVDGGPAEAARVPPPASPPAAAGSQKDVVESIVPTDGGAKETDLTAERPDAAANPQRPRDRTQIAGWARESGEWTLSRSGYRQGAPSPFDVPHDRLISRTQLHVRASHLHGDWFEATVSGVLGYSLREQGPFFDVPFDGVNGQATNAESQADLRELYAGLYSKHIDLRIGQQRVAWGRADLQSPNDVLNARDLRDPILTETELRHVPTPLIRVDIDLGGVNVQLVGTPVFVPDVYDVYGTNWSPIQADAPTAVKGLFASASPLVDPTKQGALNALLHDTQSPASNWTAPSAGAKLSTVIAGMDLDAYYHYGFDTTPYVSVSPSFAALLGTLNFQRFRPSDLMPVLQQLDAGIQPFSATYVRRHHVGLDAAAPAGPFVLRLDAAYETQRVYYHAKFTSFSSPAVLVVASVEYQTGDLDKLLLVEATYNGIVDLLDAQLLGYDQNSYGVSGTFRWPIGGGIAIDLRGLAGIEPQSFALQPAFRWKVNDSLLLKAGAVLLGGQQESLGWYYRDNTSAFVQAKYSF
jgi:uncharacterized protein DUF1302